MLESVWILDDDLHAEAKGMCGRRTLLSAGTLGLGGHADADKAVGGLKLLQGLGGVVDEGEAGGLAATELGSQAKNLDLVLLHLVHAAELLAELLLGDVGAVGVEDVTIRCISIAGLFPTYSSFLVPRKNLVLFVFHGAMASSGRNLIEPMG